MRDTKAETGTITKVQCGRCAGITSHEVLAGIDTHDASDDGDIQVWTDYWVIRCRGCEETSFLRRTHCTEDQPDEEPQVTLFPPRLGGRVPQSTAWHEVPVPVRRVHAETVIALASGQPVLAGIGIRLLVESVCADKKASGYGLAKQIENLVVKGVLTRDGADILHRTRVLGNSSAHGAVAATDEQLLAAMEVAEYLIHGVYTLPAIATALPRPPPPKPTAPGTKAAKGTKATKAPAGAPKSKP